MDCTELNLFPSRSRDPCPACSCGSLSSSMSAYGMSETSSLSRCRRQVPQTAIPDGEGTAWRNRGLRKCVPSYSKPYSSLNLWKVESDEWEPSSVDNRLHKVGAGCPDSPLLPGKDTRASTHRQGLYGVSCHLTRLYQGHQRHIVDLK